MKESSNNRMSRYDKNKEKEEKDSIEKNNNDQEITEERKKILDTTPKKIFFIIFLIIIILIIYATTIGTNFINIKEYKVESNLLPDSFHGMKIVQLSDIHYGTTINSKQLEKIINKVNKLKPDIIFFTGDLIDKNISLTDDIKNEVNNELSKINKDTYKYAIYGNEDDKEVYKELMESSGFKLLDNENTLLYYKDSTPIMITGFNIKDTNPNYTILTDYVDDIDTSNFYKIVLVHEPDTIDNFINYNPNLILSGHTLGGLIRIPFLKPLFLPENSQNYYNDYYNINNCDIFISNGLGTSNLKARLNNHPSINFYRLYKTKEVLNS